MGTSIGSRAKESAGSKHVLNGLEAVLNAVYIHTYTHTYTQKPFICLATDQVMQARFCLP